MRSCPQCDAGLATIAGAPPWCPQCEWGLALFEPDRRYDGTGWRWLDRRLYARLYARAAADRPSVGTRWLSRLAGALVYAAALGCLAAGVRLGTWEFPSLFLVPGLILVALGVEAWPRPRPRPRDATVLPPDEAPALHALIGRVAAELGLRRRPAIWVDDRFGAEASVHGIRHRRYLLIGVPLWNCLSRQQRVALLGHYLAHFVNRDPRRSRLEGDAVAALNRLISILTPGRARTIRALQDPAVLGAQLGSGQAGGGLSSTASAVWLTELIWKPIAAVLRAPLQLLQLVLVLAPRRYVRQAEHAADALAARAGGSDAAVQLLDLLLIAPTMLTVVARETRAGAPVSSWYRTAATALVDGADQLPLRRQLSIRRQVSISTGRPPLGLRARVLRSRAPVAAAITLDQPDSARIDAELAKHSERIRRDLARGAPFPFSR